MLSFYVKIGHFWWYYILNTKSMLLLLIACLFTWCFKINTCNVMIGIVKKTCTNNREIEMHNRSIIITKASGILSYIFIQTLYRSHIHHLLQVVMIYDIACIAQNWTEVPVLVSDFCLKNENHCMYYCIKQTTDSWSRDLYFLEVKKSL